MYSYSQMQHWLQRYTSASEYYLATVACASKVMRYSNLFPIGACVPNCMMWYQWPDHEQMLFVACTDLLLNGHHGSSCTLLSLPIQKLMCWRVLWGVQYCNTYPIMADDKNTDVNIMKASLASAVASLCLSKPLIYCLMQHTLIFSVLILTSLARVMTCC